MSRIDGVIELVKEARTGKNRPWIYDENGNIADGVICGDIIPFLDELKGYEISVSDGWITHFVQEVSTTGFNTYNFNACVSNDFVVWHYENDDVCIIAMAVHLFGDARCNYSDYFVCRFDSLEEFFELESALQSIEINDRFVADVSIFDECYSVYDYVNGGEVGEFYETEKCDLMEELMKRA